MRSLAEHSAECARAKFHHLIKTLAKAAHSMILNVHKYILKLWKFAETAGQNASSRQICSMMCLQLCFVSVIVTHEGLLAYVILARHQV